MSNSVENAKKPSRLKAIKTQFKKIIWPSREDVVRESAAVLVISLILGVLIAGLDRVLLLLTDLIISL